MTLLKPLWIVGALLACVSSSPAAGLPTRMTLDGTWQLHDAAEPATTIAATVPGVVQTDLFAAGRIGDPFDQDNAQKQQWISDRTWAYSITFAVPAELRQRKHVLLRFEGLDTIATIELNGHEIAKTDNMFRTYEFDVTSALKDAENELKVTFSPLEPYIDAFTQAAHGPNSTGPNVANVRKSPYQNGWDFCARARTCGIYKHVELLGYDDARLRGALVESEVDVDHAAAKLRVMPAIQGTAKKVQIDVTRDGKPVASRTIDADAVPVAIAIPNPQLWWPHGMGEQPLYDVSVFLLADDGQTLDHVQRRVGLRKIELIPKRDDGHPMQLLVNGRPFFAKGASWVPADLFLPRVTPKHLRQLVQDAADANMNMIRTWGGGAYEDDAFFDACDELGILVWSDFKFACSVYPGGNPAFADNVRHEIDDQVLRIGSHPSIAVWCGNNECLGLVTGYKLLSQADYDAFYDGIVGKRLRELLPGATFVDGSPGPAGDEHNWWVWHVGADFEKFRESHGFMSEFGFQSFPHPATVDSYARPQDQTDVLTPIMMAHQHNGNGKGNEMILNVIERYFRPAADTQSTIWLSQINQAYGMTIGIDHWRSDWPGSSGALVWQLDDCYPGPTWSLIDYYGRRKAAWYAVRRAFAPISVAADVGHDGVVAKIVSDLREPTTVQISWNLTDLEGRSIAHGSRPAKLEAGRNVCEVKLDQTDVAEANRSDRILWIEVQDGEQVVGRKTLLYARPKALELRDPQIQTIVEPGESGTYRVTLTTKRPALFAWLDVDGDPDARFDDNFIDLSPGAGQRTIVVTLSKPIDAADFERRLHVRSLFDLAKAPVATQP